MQRLHALAGLPRAGSTLLANALNQHPDIYVSGTSPLFGCLNSVSGFLTNCPETQAELANIPGTYGRYLGAMRAFTEEWYSYRQERVCIDKGRGWTLRPQLLSQLWPGSVLIACVRDPRDVIASVIRQDRSTALFASQLGSAAQQMASQLLSVDGMIGGPLTHIESALLSNVPILYVQYEEFVQDPRAGLDRLVGVLGLDPFDFDVENVENVATDLDVLYLGKYPHEGSGPIKPAESDWHDVLSEQLANDIVAAYPTFMETFKYQ